MFDTQALSQVQGGLDRKDIFEALNCDLKQYFNERQSVTISQGESFVSNGRPGAVTAPSNDTGRPQTRELGKGRDSRKRQLIRESLFAVSKRPQT